MQSKSPFLRTMQSKMRLRHFSRRTEATYLYWIKRFDRHGRLTSPDEMQPDRVHAFLHHLVVERGLSAATQQQALAALIFAFREVLGRPLEGLEPLPRGRVPTTLPVVLTQGEVRAVLAP